MNKFALTIVALGALALGTAGVLVGSALQERIAKVLAPVAANDPTGITGLVAFDADGEPEVRLRLSQVRSGRFAPVGVLP